MVSILNYGMNISYQHARLL